MVINITKQDGHVTDTRTLDQCLAFLANGEYVATIETKEQYEKRKPRTLNQNALLHVWCRYISKALTDYTGDVRWTPDEVKSYFAWRFGDWKESPTGERRWQPVETHRLNKTQMHDYMECIQQYVASECGITVPLPDDERYKDFQAYYN